MSDGTMTNSFCCLPTPAGADKMHPKISYCSPQYNQTDHTGSIPDVVPNNWGSGGSTANYNINVNFFSEFCIENVEIMENYP